MDTRYLWNLATLWADQSIDLAAVLYALKHRPAAICGKGGAYQLDDSLALGN